jgi:hypothetical protein
MSFLAGAIVVFFGVLVLALCLLPETPDEGEDSE